MEDWCDKSRTMLNLGDRRKWLIIFTARPLYSSYPGRRKIQPLGRRLDGPHSQSGRDSIETNTCPFRESNSSCPITYVLGYPGS
jgi:hypothetical protein